MYSTNEDIRDGLLRGRATKKDHEKAEKYIDNVLFRFNAPDHIKSLPLVKELAVAFASYKIAFRLWMKPGDLFHQKVKQHERVVAHKTNALIRICNKCRK